MVEKGRAFMGKGCGDVEGIHEKGWGVWSREGKLCHLFEVSGQFFDHGEEVGCAGCARLYKGGADGLLLTIMIEPKEPQNVEEKNELEDSHAALPLHRFLA